MTNTAKPSPWVKTNDYYNREVVKCDVYTKQITKKRKIHLQDSENFTYTFSCGAHSEYSFTGSFFGTTVKTLEQAMEYLDKFAPLWLLPAERYNPYRFSSDKSPRILLQELKDSIKIQ